MDDATRGMVGLFVMCAFFIIKANSSGKEPTFTNLNINRTTNLTETAPVHSIVYTLMATDPEADNLTYGKVSQVPSQPDFQLNTKTGELYSPSGIDPDCKNIDADCKNIGADCKNNCNYLSQFVFKFDVSDGTCTVQSANLTVNIIDVNDNYPSFNCSQFNTSVLNTAVSGENVTEVTATDADKTSQLSYLIIQTYIDGYPPDNTVFIIAQTGQISVNRNLTYLNNTRNFNLTVQASDGTFSNTTKVYIKVIKDLCYQTNPCQNNGTCHVNISSGNSTCHCSVEWTGENCSTAEKISTTTILSTGLSTDNTSESSSYPGPDLSTGLSSSNTTCETTTPATDSNNNQTSGNSNSDQTPVTVGITVTVVVVIAGGSGTIIVKFRCTKQEEISKNSCIETGQYPSK